MKGGHNERCYCNVLNQLPVLFEVSEKKFVRALGAAEFFMHAGEDLAARQQILQATGRALARAVNRKLSVSNLRKIGPPVYSFESAKVRRRLHSDPE